MASMGFEPAFSALEVIKHLFNDGKMNFLRNISETAQCQPVLVLD